MLSSLLRIYQRLVFRILKPIQGALERQVNARWHNYPFGQTPRGSRDKYIRLATDAKTQSYPEVDAFEISAGFTLDTGWLHDLALHTQVVIKKSPLCYAHGRVLYSALSAYLRDNPCTFPTEKITIWETGTARGFSALCMAKALHDQKRAGTIVTFDILPHHTKMFWNCIDDWDGPKTRSELLNPWKILIQNYILFHQGDTRLELPKVKSNRIHFAFLDGVHSYEDVILEFENIREQQKPGDVIVYDDYQDQFSGVVKAVDYICYSHSYTRNVIRSQSNRTYVVTIKN